VSATTRIARRFAALQREGRGALVTFVTAGDPDLATSSAILEGLPAAGADLIELGMPFSDPMADGPAIQASGQRALRGGHTMDRTLDMVRRFRERDDETPVILMGYYNPIYVRGPAQFAQAAKAAGIDGLIVVDLPPEEAGEAAPAFAEAGLDLVMLATPTSDDARLPAIVKYGSGFLYYVSILGITGTKSSTGDAVRAAVERLRRHTGLPVAVGFGIKTPEQAGEVATLADAAVVGSAIVERIKAGLDENGQPREDCAAGALAFVAELAAGVRGATHAA
jgi:tryptophan synthase alpha chain